MSIFERQLRIWGDTGQTKIENSIFLLTKCGSKINDLKLIEELSISLKLAGVTHIINTEELEAEKLRLREPAETTAGLVAAPPDGSVIHIIYSNDGKFNARSLPEEFAKRQIFELTIIESSTSPVIVMITETLRPCLILAHQIKSIPPFTLTALPLKDLAEKWIAPEAKRDGGARTPSPESSLITSPPPKKLPWMLILYWCAQSLRRKSEKISASGLKAELKNLNCDEECLREARLHMYWILNEPNFDELVQALEILNTEPEVHRLREGLKALGRFPVAGDLTIDNLCDPKIWSELHTLLLRLKEEDQAILQTDSFSMAKGLGTLKVLEASKNKTCGKKASETEVSRGVGKIGELRESYQKSIEILIRENEKINSLGIPADHLLSSVLSSENSQNSNSTILHGLINIYQYLNVENEITGASGADTLSTSETFEALVKRDYPDLAGEDFVKDFELPEPFRIVNKSIVGAAISTEILKALTQQFTLTPGIVMFE